MYLDAAYVVKHYLNEPESNAIRLLVRSAGLLASSALALTEVQCVFHRKVREGSLTADMAAALCRAFLAHVDEGFWTLVPVRESLLRRAGAIVLASPPSLFSAPGTPFISPAPMNWAKKRSGPMTATCSREPLSSGLSAGACNSAIQSAENSRTSARKPRAAFRLYPPSSLISHRRARDPPARPPNLRDTHTSIAIKARPNATLLTR